MATLPILAVLLAAVALPAPASGDALADGVGTETPVFSLASPVGQFAYAPGRGLRIGDTGFTLGGYSNVSVVRNEGEPGRLTLDELSFFVFWDPVRRVHVFSELELEDLLSIDTDGAGGTSDNRFEVERLYGEVDGLDWLNLRVGKFLTPVGRWNVIHAQPLVWTTSRPLVTDIPFDENTTGVSIFGSFFPSSGSVTYQLFGQFVNQFESTPQIQEAERSGGARLEYATRGNVAVGGTYMGFRSTDRWYHLGGFDMRWRNEAAEVLAELEFDEAEGRPGSQWGMYFQGVVRVAPQVYAVGRYEYFDPRGGDSAVHLFDLGLAYKPAAFVVLKAEYLIADHHSEHASPGFKSSVAVLF